MLWATLAMLGGFGHALGWALKKKALDNKGINNTLGFVSFAVAGIIFLTLWGISDGFDIPPISQRFMIAAGAVVLLNILALWTAYRALDKAAFSKLMPYIALTSLTIVPIEYYLRDVFPNTPQILGMVLVVIGAIIFAKKEPLTRDTLKVAGYFGVTLVCYSITSPYMSVMIEETSGLFSGAVAHIGIAFGFLCILYCGAREEFTSIRTLKANGEWRKIFLYMVAAGFVTALIENGPVNIALESANASEVFALKRTMPIFALILGVMMFNEVITKRHWVGVGFLVAGSMLVIWFKN